MTTTPSPNFAYLAHHDPKLVAIATQAEMLFPVAPVATLTALRAFGELLAKRAAARLNLLGSRQPGQMQETQQQLIDRLHDARAINGQQRSLFHDLRRAGNEAAHDWEGERRMALHQLQMARELGIWFQRAFGNNRKFEPGPFVAPPDAPPPSARSTARAMDAAVAAAKAEAKAAAEAMIAAEAQARAAAETQLATEAERRAAAEALAKKAAEDVAIMEALLQEAAAAQSAQTAEAAAQLAKLEAELRAVQAQAAATPAAVQKQAVTASLAASEAIVLDEHATRMIIDAQLRAAGWEADTDALDFRNGARPQKGRNLAIAEWPALTDGKAGRIDYVLFAGLVAVAVVEAKRKHKDIPAVLGQAKRYAAGIVLQGPGDGDATLPEGAPWGAHRVPFLFATNGRPYLRQLVTKSGIWFLDGRKPTNHAVALEGWYSPEGLLDVLKQEDAEAAHVRLDVEPMPYIDRDYQQRAIRAVEGALAGPPRKENERHTVLLAMATGTGKTITCIGLCYRLLKAKRFRRILFVVDRNALATQTIGALKTVRLEQLQTFTDVYDVKEIGDVKVERETRLHVATIQAMMRRVLGPHDDASEAAVPPVDAYDCIVVDECHRGYLLDKELSERELALTESKMRDEVDFISRYRRVLDHFDAVKIGLTATPALHTAEIFGPAVFTYGYREAVADGFLVDHDPPIRIVTKLAKDGIHYEAKQEVLVLDRAQQQLFPEVLADEVDFEIEDFNRQVISENFTRAVLEEVARHVDPSLPEKTLVFCVDDDHADNTVRLFKEALAKVWGEVDDGAVEKITGSVDRPTERIKHFRNEQLPKFVVTVDLLTTGIDVPRIANLVFLRRVRSRILYEQMLGRATRLCPDIDKERFRVFDAVDLYGALSKYSDMKPLVVQPSVTFAQLVAEILASEDPAHRDEAILELTAKLQRKKRHLKDAAGEHFEAAAGNDVKEVIRLLRQGGAEAAAWLRNHPQVASLLDGVKSGQPYRPVVSEHFDEVREVTRGYGDHQKPEDFLDAFRRFVTENVNQVPALQAVVTRPRDLTRAHLKELRLLLDQKGYSEANIEAAYRQTRNQDIAASIIGFIRPMAIGSPLVPYRERIDAGVRRFLATRTLTELQRKNLDRIVKLMKSQVVVDKDALDQAQFAAEGGFKQMNKRFDGKLEAVLADLAEEVWRDVS